MGATDRPIRRPLPPLAKPDPDDGTPSPINWRSVLDAEIEGAAKDAREYFELPEVRQRIERGERVVLGQIALGSDHDPDPHGGNPLHRYSPAPDVEGGMEPDRFGEWVPFEIVDGLLRREDKT